MRFSVLKNQLIINYEVLSALTQNDLLNGDHSKRQHRGVQNLNELVTESNGSLKKIFYRLDNLMKLFESSIYFFDIRQKVTLKTEDSQLFFQPLLLFLLHSQYL